LNAITATTNGKLLVFIFQNLSFSLLQVRWDSITISNYFFV
jgi:hypothetical protein